MRRFATLQLGLRFSAGLLVQCDFAVRCAFAEEDDFDCQVVPAYVSKQGFVVTILDATYL